MANDSNKYIIAMGKLILSKNRKEENNEKNYE